MKTAWSIDIKIRKSSVTIVNSLNVYSILHLFMKSYREDSVVAQKQEYVEMTWSSQLHLQSLLLILRL